MGGFHGGHGGGFGGGFGGGHNSGTSFNVTPTYRRHNGRLYVTPVYGTTNGQPMDYFSYMFLTILIMLVGLFIFIFCFTFKTTATVTDTYNAHDISGIYEKYDFEYEVLNKTYTGHGDDDVIFTGSSYYYQVNVDEEYPIYVHIYNFSKYEFDNEDLITCVIFCPFLELFGLTLLISGLMKHKQHKKDLKEIGDINRDGKIDEEDFNSLPKENEKKCPYCGSILKKDDKECKSCGAKDI